MYRSRSAALFALGTILLFVPSFDVVYADGTQADSMCNPYHQECPCDQVPNPDRQSPQKCIQGGKGSNTHGCPIGVCVDSTNNEKTLGICIATNKCDAQKTADGQTPQKPTPEQMKGSMQGSQSTLQPPSAPAGQPNTLQLQGPNGSLLNWALDPTPLSQQSPTNSEQSVAGQIENIAKSPTPDFIQQAESAFQNLFSPNPVASESTQLQGGTVTGIEPNNNINTVSGEPSAPPLQSYPSANTFGSTPTDVNGQPLTEQQLAQQASTFQQTPAPAQASDCNWICATANWVQTTATALGTEVAGLWKQANSFADNSASEAPAAKGFASNEALNNTGVMSDVSPSIPSDQMASQEPKVPETSNEVLNNAQGVASVEPTGNEPPADASTKPVIDPYLADQRAQIMTDLAANPALQARVAALTALEVGSQGPAAQQAFLESMVNRSIMNGYTSLGQAINSFYAPVNSGALDTYVAQGVSQADLAAADNATAQVAAGSNICNFCTDQGAASTIHGPAQSIGGEFFGNMNGNPSWANAQAQAQASYGVGQSGSFASNAGSLSYASNNIGGTYFYAGLQDGGLYQEQGPLTNYQGGIGSEVIANNSDARLNLSADIVPPAVNPAVPDIIAQAPSVDSVRDINLSAFPASPIPFETASLPVLQAQPEFTLADAGPRPLSFTSDGYSGLSRGFSAGSEAFANPTIEPAGSAPLATVANGELPPAVEVGNNIPVPDTSAPAISPQAQIEAQNAQEQAQLAQEEAKIAAGVPMPEIVNRSGQDIMNQMQKEIAAGVPMPEPVMVNAQQSVENAVAAEQASLIAQNNQTEADIAAQQQITNDQNKALADRIAQAPASAPTPNLGQQVADWWSNIWSAPETAQLTPGNLNAAPDTASIFTPGSPLSSAVFTYGPDEASAFNNLQSPFAYGPGEASAFNNLPSAFAYGPGEASAFNNLPSQYAYGPGEASAFNNLPSVFTYGPSEASAFNNLPSAFAYGPGEASAFNNLPSAFTYGPEEGSAFNNLPSEFAYGPGEASAFNNLPEPQMVNNLSLEYPSNDTLRSDVASTPANPSTAPETPSPAEIAADSGNHLDSGGQKGVTLTCSGGGGVCGPNQTTTAAGTPSPQGEWIAVPAKNPEGIKIGDRVDVTVGGQVKEGVLVADYTRAGSNNYVASGPLESALQGTGQDAAIVAPSPRSSSFDEAGFSGVGQGTSPASVESQIPVPEPVIQSGEQITAQIQAQNAQNAINNTSFESAGAGQQPSLAEQWGSAVVNGAQNLGDTASSLWSATKDAAGSAWDSLTSGGQSIYENLTGGATSASLPDINPYEYPQTSGPDQGNMQDVITQASSQALPTQELNPTIVAGEPPADTHPANPANTPDIVAANANPATDNRLQVAADQNPPVTGPTPEEIQAQKQAAIDAIVKNARPVSQGLSALQAATQDNPQAAAIKAGLASARQIAANAVQAGDQQLAGMANSFLKASSNLNSAYQAYLNSSGFASISLGLALSDMRTNVVNLGNNVLNYIRKNY